MGKGSSLNRAGSLNRDAAADATAVAKNHKRITGRVKWSVAVILKWFYDAKNHPRESLFKGGYIVSGIGSGIAKRFKDFAQVIYA